MTDVRKSGLYSVKKIDMRVLDILNGQQKDITYRDLRITTLQSTIEVEKKKVEDQKITISKKDSLIANYSRRIKDKDDIIKKRNEEVKSLLKNKK